MNNIPCRLCLTLPVCRERFIDFYRSRFNYLSAYGIIVSKMHCCILSKFLFQYIKELSKYDYYHPLFHASEEIGMFFTGDKKI